MWQHHPVAGQAALQREWAAAEMRAARGEFDPVLSSGWNDKYFDGKHYYRIFDAGFQIPTWFGLSVNGGYESADGLYLNPENKTDKNGLWTIGLEANLLQGLLIDDRRAALQQAKVFQQASENERIRILNELLFAATEAYIDWQAAYFTRQIIGDALNVAGEYLEATRQSFINGDKPAIDTLEAYLIVQDRLLQYQSNEIEVIRARQQLENFLWYDQIPLELQPATLPEEMGTENFEIPVSPVVDQILANHPDLLEKDYKIAQYSIEQRLKRDKLKPKLKLKYNPLVGTADTGVSPDYYSIANYKWGFNFSMPLFLRSERAAIQMTGLKIREVEFELMDKRNSLRNKIEANLQKQNLLAGQVALQEQNRSNYGVLLEAEGEKFSYGESSVFLLNKRQEKYLESSVKRIELVAKLQLARAEYLYVTGQFPGEME
ncbi:MAG: TolC family protein [Lewinellaceae bacterium]|nr:TolC family protein [Lewinellaceae bacterium]